MHRSNSYAGWATSTACEPFSPPLAMLPRMAVNNKLRPGDAAPRFEMPGSDGKTHRLEDHLGRRAVVIAWFPKASTPG